MFRLRAVTASQGVQMGAGESKFEWKFRRVLPCSKKSWERAFFNFLNLMHSGFESVTEITPEKNYLCEQT